MAKVVVHIDLNAFFVSAEELRDPILIGKAVIVGGKGRGGIVSTCSYEARKYGIHSGMPTFKAVQLYRDVIIKPVDYEYYAKLSKRFFEFVKTYTSIIEPASIDECYADFTKQIIGINAKTYFLNLQRELYKKTGLKCSIGIAPTKFLAKMASDMKKPMGLTILRRKDFKEKLYPLPIKEMYGIGKKTYPKLEEMGIKTIGDLAYRLNQGDKETIDFLGTFSYGLKEWLNGFGDDNVDVSPFNPKSIGTSTTLNHDSNDLEEISQVLRKLSKEVSENAKKERKKGTTIQIVAKDITFKTHNKSYSFKNPTNDFNIIYSIALKLYEKNFDGLVIRLVGVTLQNLVSPEDEVIQMSLFNYEEFEEESRTKLLINELNRKMGKDVFKRASEAKKDGNK
jgi:DNA polymerase-4